VKERDLTNKARAQVLLPARSFLMKKDPLTLTSCIGPLKLIGVFARLSWSDLRGDRCAIFSPDSTCTRNKSVSEVARSSRQRTHATNFSRRASLLTCSFFRVFVLTRPLTRAKIRKKQDSVVRRTYTNKKKSFSFSCTRKKYAHSLYSHHGHYFNRDAVERDELLSAAKIVVVVVEQTNLFEQKIHRLFECSKTSFRLVFEKGIRRCLGIFGQD